MSAPVEAPQAARDLVRWLMQLGEVEVPPLTRMQWAVLRGVVRRGVPVQVDGRDLWAFELESTAVKLAALEGLRFSDVVTALDELSAEGWIRPVRIGRRGLSLYTVELGKVAELLDQAKRVYKREPEEPEEEASLPCPLRCGGAPEPGEDACPACGGTGAVPISDFCACSTERWKPRYGDHGVGECETCGGWL